MSAGIGLASLGGILAIAGPAWIIIAGRSSLREDRARAWWGIPAFFLGALFVALGIAAPGLEYSDGVRVGYVTKLSKKGLLFLTWEGEMQLGGISPDAGGAVSARTWEFSVSNTKVAEELLKAMEGGTRLQLHYKEFFGRGVSLGSTPYDILEVKK